MRGTLVCPLQGKLHTVVLRGVGNISETAVKSPYEVSPVKVHLAYFPPPDTGGRRRAPGRGGNNEWSSGGEKYPFFPFTGEISYRCFTGRQKYF